MTEDVHRAAAFGHQGGKDADGGGFAGTVGAEQGEEITFSHVQVDTVQRLEAVAIGLGQLANGQSSTHKNAHT